MEAVGVDEMNLWDVFFPYEKRKTRNNYHNTEPGLYLYIYFTSDYLALLIDEV